MGIANDSIVPCSNCLTSICLAVSTKQETDENVSFSGRLPQLDKCHAHTIAAIVKKLFFMKPAIPKNSRASFIQAAKDINDNSDPQALNRAISELSPVRQLTKKFFILVLAK